MNRLERSLAAPEFAAYVRWCLRCGEMDCRPLMLAERQLGAQPVIWARTCVRWLWLGTANGSGPSSDERSPVAVTVRGRHAPKGQ